MTNIFLALGTNLGDRLKNLQRALTALPPSVHVLRSSPIYETSPWGITDQPEFLNMVIEGETKLSPLDLLRFLKDLERQLGRTPSLRYGPRLIDLDILFYDELLLDTPELTIPHPRLHERAFVLVPLADLAPDFLHPRLGRPVRDLLMAVERTGIRLYLG
ncbi:MAG: 2-amino-4-hydroxy-6-hydroxymethyldihydropteridine diphosphokinase [Anaerolineales bacterium]|nr:2-amino-4-hydroxy-6-hydroxymethyldihydropteridine diphosphokinase [Anaerolineales bacterium]MCX7608001.1 2-amino-4-hydroxy-6-hydroxymethyldihydropteridine diphosphokinase [Anaerolineales bacterium]MDW8227793.1 2-amino-4-hydroxy-6-hydroxymethyldihydropteridine diphosphokinase [Anaerolineales bacterium]